MAERRLRRRLAIAALAPPIVLVLASIVLLPAWSYKLEDLVLRNITAATLDAVRSDGAAATFEAGRPEWLLRAGVGPLPSEISNATGPMEPGVHEFVDLDVLGETRDIFVAVRGADGSDSGAHVVVDASRLEAVRESTTSAAVVAALGLVSTGLMLTVWLLLRSVSRRVSLLTAMAAATSHEERMRSQRAASAYGDELGRIADLLGDTMDRLEHTARRERAFARNASHELRTPIGVAANAVELLGRHLPDRDDRGRQLLGRARSALERMRELVELFLSVAAADHSLSDESPESVAVIAADVVEAIALSHPLAADRFEISQRHGTTATCGSGPLSAVLRGLLLNAIRHAPDGTPIRVRIEGNELVVENRLGDDSAEATGAPGAAGGLGLFVLEDLAVAADLRLSTAIEDERFVARVMWSEAAPGGPS